MSKWEIVVHLQQWFSNLSGEAFVCIPRAYPRGSGSVSLAGPQEYAFVTSSPRGSGPGGHRLPFRTVTLTVITTGGTHLLLSPQPVLLPSSSLEPRQKGDLCPLKEVSHSVGFQNNLHSKACLYWRIPTCLCFCSRFLSLICWLPFLSPTCLI